MSKIYYDIRTSGSGVITVPFNVAAPNGWTVGTTATFTFEFPDFSEDLTVTDTYTVSGVESYGTITVEPGATLTIPSGTVLQGNTLDQDGTIDQDGTLTIKGSLSNATLNQYVEWAGSYATLEMLDNSVKYRMQLPTDAGIDSLLWGITPNSDLTDRNVVGVWGLVESIQNERNQALSTNRYSVEVTVLAEISEYAGVNAAETDLVI